MDRDGTRPTALLRFVLHDLFDLQVDEVAASRAGDFRLDGDRIVAIDLVADAERLDALDLLLPGD